MEGSSVSFEGKTNGVSSPIFERTVTVLTCIALAATPLICHFISACSPLFVLGSGIFATIGILAIIAAAVFNGVFKPTSGAVVDLNQNTSASAFNTSNQQAIDPSVTPHLVDDLVSLGKAKDIHRQLGIGLTEILPETLQCIPPCVDFKKICSYGAVSSYFEDFTKFLYKVHGIDAVSAWTEITTNKDYACEYFLRPANCTTDKMVIFNSLNDGSFTCLPVPDRPGVYLPAYDSRRLRTNPDRSAYFDKYWTPLSNVSNCRELPYEIRVPKIPLSPECQKYTKFKDQVSSLNPAFYPYVEANQSVFVNSWLHAKGESMPSYGSQNENWLPSVHDNDLTGKNQFDFSRITDSGAPYQCYVSCASDPTNGRNFFEAMHQEKINFVVDLMSKSDISTRYGDHDPYECHVRNSILTQQGEISKHTYTGPNNSTYEISVTEYTYRSFVNTNETSKIIRIHLPNISDGTMGNSPDFMKWCADQINNPGGLNETYKELPPNYVFNCMGGLGRSPTMMAYCVLCRAKELAESSGLGVCVDFEKNDKEIIGSKLNLANVLRRIMTQGYFSRSSFIQRAGTQLHWIINAACRLAGEQEYIKIPEKKS